MKTTLEQLRDVLAGTADETTTDAIRDGLSNSGNAVKQFFDAGKIVALRPCAFKWVDIAAMIPDLDDETAYRNHLTEWDVESLATEEESLHRFASKPTSSASDQPRSRLERLRDRLVGSESVDATDGADERHGLPSNRLCGDSPVISPDPPTTDDRRHLSNREGLAAASGTTSPQPGPTDSEMCEEDPHVLEAGSAVPSTEPAPESVAGRFKAPSDEEITGKLTEDVQVLAETNLLNEFTSTATVHTLGPVDIPYAPSDAITSYLNDNACREMAVPNSDFLIDFAGPGSITFSPQNFKPEIGQFPSEASLRTSVQMVRQVHFDTIFTYALDNALSRMPELAHQMGLRVVARLYYYAAALAQELRAAAAPYVDALIVGIEGLDQGRYTLDQLRAGIREIARFGESVGTVEPTLFLIVHPGLIPELQTIDGVTPLVTSVHDPQQASNYVRLQFDELHEAWFSAGGGHSATNQRLIQELLRTGVPTIIGEVFDQNFKAHFAPYESYFGLFAAAVSRLVHVPKRTGYKGAWIGSNDSAIYHELDQPVAQALGYVNGAIVGSETQRRFDSNQGTAVGEAKLIEYLDYVKAASVAPIPASEIDETGALVLELTILEDRTAPAVLHALNVGLDIPSGEHPGSSGRLAETEALERLTALAPYTDGMRTFRCTGDYQPVSRMIHELGKTSYIGAWIGSNDAANYSELNQLIAQGLLGYVDVAIVGSEALRRFDSEAKVPLVTKPVDGAEMGRYHDHFGIYEDLNSVGNHVHEIGQPVPGDSVSVNGSWTATKHQGATVLRFGFDASCNGYYMLNGILQGSMTKPIPNFGETPNSVIDLSGADFFVGDNNFEYSAAKREQRLNYEPRFLRSFTTEPFQDQPTPVRAFDNNLRNVAFTYDNALAALAFLAEGIQEGLRRARLIGDAFVYATQHDRTRNDGRPRSAYLPGDNKLPAGWTPNGRPGTATVPGFYDEAGGVFTEIGQEAIDTGNNAWGMIALLAIYKRTGTPAYLDSARTLGEFINTFRNTNSTYQGFMGGIDNPESTSTTTRPWASTEHNLDVYVAFREMYSLTNETVWLAGMQHANDFIEAMWDPSNGLYLTGTTDPETRNSSPAQLPLDVQAWSVLALPDVLSIYPQLPDSVESAFCTTSEGTGYGFNSDPDGAWFEGTAQIAVAYSFASQQGAAERIRQELRRAQDQTPFGHGTGIVTAHDGFGAGIGFSYFNRLHIGVTAWNVFAQLESNPYSQTIRMPPLTDIGGGAASSGKWWVAASHGDRFASQLWGRWSTAATWVDLLDADVNGDGKSDRISRSAITRQWWVALSSGSGFTNDLWSQWTTTLTGSRCDRAT